jgi:transcriptional regulator with XRE-family HTH domain
MEEYTSNLIDNLLNSITPNEQAKVDAKMIIAVRIADGLKLRGWKKSEFANALKKRPSEITKWLSGTHNFTIDTLIEIENILDIELIQLEKKPLVISKTYVIQVTSPAGLSYSGFGSQLQADNSIKHFFSFKN